MKRADHKSWVCLGTLLDDGTLKGRRTDYTFHQSDESAHSVGHTARGTLKLAIPEIAYHLLVREILVPFQGIRPVIPLAERPVKVLWRRDAVIGYAADAA